MRDISTLMKSLLDGSTLSVFFAVEMDLDSGSIFMWSGVGDLTFGGNTYAGVGTLVNIGQIEEVSELSARGASITLNGIPSTMLSMALTEKYQGRKAFIRFGVITDSGAEVLEVFSGFLDQMNINEGSETCSISVTIESKLIDLERPRVSRYNSATQKAIYPDDLGFDFVESLQDKQFTWGVKSDG